MRLVINILAIIFFCYSLYCGFLFFMQRRLVFPRFLINTDTEKVQIIPGIEKKILHTGSGKVEMWYIPPVNILSDKLSPAVIFAHGNAELIDILPEELKEFSNLGVGALLVEYPGYGRSEGSPSQQSITEAFILAYDYLTARNDIDASRIIFAGRSIGGGAVCALSEKRTPAAIILMSTFTSLRPYALKFFAPGCLMRDKFDNLKTIRSYNGPVLITHGKNDEIIPYSHGIALSKVAKNCTMITYDSGHNDFPPDPVFFWKDIKKFLIKSGIIC